MGMNISSTNFPKPNVSTFPPAEAPIAGDNTSKAGLPPSRLSDTMRGSSNQTQQVQGPPGQGFNPPGWDPNNPRTGGATDPTTGTGGVTVVGDEPVDELGDEELSEYKGGPGKTDPRDKYGVGLGYAGGPEELEIEKRGGIGSFGAAGYGKDFNPWGKNPNPSDPLTYGAVRDNKIAPKVTAWKDTLNKDAMKTIKEYFADPNHKAAKGKYMDWVKLINKGQSPLVAAQNIGDSDLHKLGTPGMGGGLQQWQFRLDGYMRCSFTHDKTTGEVRVIDFGHT